MIEPTWVIMPILAAPELTEAAIADVLAQSIPVRLLLVNQGVDDAFRDRLERIAEEYEDKVLLWSHMPPLPSLSASWNRALDFVWALSVGRVEEWCALVVNNDVRLPMRTVEVLRAELSAQDALFVSAVGVTQEQYDAAASAPPDLSTKGGPDFSCFLISYACHARFRFDESFIPAFCEDLDTHRRLMLAGEGQRIFSVNLPYLHYASQTLKTLPDKEAARVRQQIESQSRVYYAKKWGGPVNAETFSFPFDDPARDEGGVLDTMPHPPTTTALFDKERQQWASALKT